MEKTIEIKAIDREKALERALKILSIESEEIKKNIIITEKVKPKKKLFGLLGIENGVYEITLKEASDKKEKESKLEINKEKNIKKVKKIIENKKEKKVENKILEIKNKEEKVNIKRDIKVKIDKIDAEEKNIEEKIEKTVKDLLSKMNLTLEIEIKKIRERNYLVNLYGKDNAIIIGQKGKTLNNFEYILNSLVANCRIEIDVEKFKEKRIETLKNLGKKMAEKVIKTNKIVRLNAMPARERKIIHEVIGKYQGLDTYSEGREPKRYIVIKKKK